MQWDRFIKIDIIIVRLFHYHDNEQETDSFIIFEVPIGNAKVVKAFLFHKDAPTLIFRQKSLNSCCFSSLASAFASIKQIKAAYAISLRINESLTSEVGNGIHFAFEIMQNRKRNKGEPREHYSLERYSMCSFNLFDTSKD